jgi:peptidoglycan/xylan/chitin deacetylase (PgdA/CDA1 family)
MAARQLSLGGAPVLMYHGIGVSIPAGVGDRESRYWISPESFGRQLAQIRDGGHSVVGLHAFWASREDPAHPPVVLTFDDGRATDYELSFPLLLEAGARAEFFVNTATIGQPGYLAWSEVVEMHRAGMSFQSHAHDHFVLPGLPPPILKNELETSKRLLEDRVGVEVGFLAAPYGLLDRRVLDTAREVGYRAVCGSLSWPARPGAATVNRVPVYRDTTAARFAAILGRQPSAFLPGVARTMLMYLPKRILLKVRPHYLGARPQTEVA